MKESRALARYAAALFRAAQAEGTVDRVEEDLGLVARTLDDNPRLREAIVSPLVPPERKGEVADAVFGEHVCPLTIRYLRLLFQSRREGLATGTAAEFARLADDARGVAMATVRSAVALSDEQALRLKRSLSSRTGRQVELCAEVDPALIGGIVVRIGDTVMDGSVAGHLERLREELLAR